MRADRPDQTDANGTSSAARYCGIVCACSVEAGGSALYSERTAASCRQYPAIAGHPSPSRPRMATAITRSADTCRDRKPSHARPSQHDEYFVTIEADSVNTDASPTTIGSPSPNHFDSSSTTVAKPVTPERRFPVPGLHWPASERQWPDSNRQ
jgi:hypothetical protein